jgi:3-oxoacyl-[acyl-carrier protein] reductase
VSGDPARPLEDTVALVTGGCAGIGRAVVARLGAAGARVAVNHPHTPEVADAWIAELQASGTEAAGFAADVSDRDEFAGMVEAVLERWGRWDTLVSNAAIAVTRPLVEFDEPSIDRLVAVNVKGVVWGMQLAARLLAEGGRVIAIGSSTTGLMLPGYSVYDATKAAVEQLVRIGAHELGSRGITVNVVAPGATATETYAAGRGDELVARFAAMSAFGRLGTPDEIAEAVAFLAGDGSGWITGQVIRVNGGTV